MRAAYIALIALAVLGASEIAGAQPEDRKRVPTTSATVDPCADLSADRRGGPSDGWPGIDPRLPAPQGATSFTGIAPPGRDPSRDIPRPAPTDQAYQECRRRMGN
jgi:hypothetical protein